MKLATNSKEDVTRQGRHFKGRVTRVCSFWGDGGITARVVIEGERKAIGLIGLQEEGEEIKAGDTYTFCGERTTHEKYGDQIKFAAYTQSLPFGKVGVKEFLEKAKGIGDKTSELLWNEFEADAVRMVLIDPARVSRIIGIDRKVIEAASKVFKELEANAEVMIELLEYFHKSNIRKSVIGEIIQLHGKKGGEWVKKNPFRLMRFSGIGFERCDFLYIRNGGLPKRIRRHAYAIEHAIMVGQREGHTWHDLRDIRRTLATESSTGTERMEIAIKFGQAIELLKEKEVDGVRCIALHRQYKDEEYVAKRVMELRRSPFEPRWGYYEGSPDDRDPPMMSIHQLRELINATQARIGILTGGPGCGKTFVVAQIALNLESKHHAIGICAPTGKAAKRCGEALQAAGVKSKPRTIHSMLRASMNKGQFSFNHNEHNPLPYQYVIVDEASMVDTQLMACLLRAIRNDSHILLVGDKNQLAPVGPGFPLRDMDESVRVPTGTLTEVRRNSGLIVAACHKIRQGEKFKATETINVEKKDNLKFLQARYENHQLDALGDVLDEIIEAGIDPINEAVVLTPKNDGGKVARIPLNWLLQIGLNPSGKLHDLEFEQEKHDHLFRIGDPMVCTRNYKAPVWDYEAGEWYQPSDENGDPELHAVVNGEPGSIVDLWHNRLFVELESRVIINVGIASEKAIDWDLGYVLTCHKSQGSEWKAVIVMLDGSPGAMMVASRQWVYTAISRGKERCYIIGDKPIMERMIGRNAMRARRTDLVRVIAEQRLGSR